jgi:hypothetical protein
MATAAFPGFSGRFHGRGGRGRRGGAGGELGGGWEGAERRRWMAAELGSLRARTGERRGASQGGRKQEARVPGGGGDLLIAGGGGGANPGAATPAMSTRRSFQESEVEDDPGIWAGFRPRRGSAPLLFCKPFF